MTEPSNLELLEKLESIINKNSSDIKEELKNINKHLEEKLVNLETKVAHLENRLIAAERKAKKNNIIIFGLDIPRGDLLKNTIVKLNEYLEITIYEADINNIYKTRNNDCIIIEFISYLKKLNVVKNTYKLKGSKISIKDDLCPEDRENNKILYRNLKTARNKNYNAHIKNHLLYINGTAYEANQLDPFPDEESFPLTVPEKSNSAPATPTTNQATNKNEEFDDVFFNSQNQGDKLTKEKSGSSNVNPKKSLSTTSTSAVSAPPPKLQPLQQDTQDRNLRSKKLSTK